jgi:elongation factor G
MKEYTTDQIRNIALASHSSSGKTMLSEAFLFFTGATTRLGKIEDGTTTSDYDEEEIRRGISLATTVIPVEYKNLKINFLDTPGYTDFVGDVISALSVADGVIILVDSVAGLEVGTEIAFQYAAEFKLPQLLVINKMERENANFKKALASVQEHVDTRLVPMQLPWGEKSDFQGVIDLVTMKAYKGDGKVVAEIPAEFKEEAESYRVALVEAAAEGEDALLEKYFENGDLSNEEVIQGLRKSILSGNFIPVLAAAGAHMTGIVPLLDAVVNLMPSPAERPAITATSPKGDVVLKTSDTGPLAAYIWKTTADPFVGKQTFFKVFSGKMLSDTRVWNSNKGEEERLASMQIPHGKENYQVPVVHSGDLGTVAKLNYTTTGDTLSSKDLSLKLPVPKYPNALYRVAVSPKTQSDATKMSSTLTRICEEDMTLSWFNEAATRETILQGMGDQHIDVVVRRADSKFQLGLNTFEPKVPYEEHITKEARDMYRHKKQTGGSGQFGEVHLVVSPLKEEDFKFSNDVFGGAISSNYMTSIEKGIRSILKEGVIAGFPVKNVAVSIVDGKEHPVDSKPIAFEIAGREAFRLAFKQAGPVLFEPIMKVKITVPEGNMGDIMGDMNSRRARIQGMDTDRGKSVVTAMVPLAEMLRYTTTLRSMTGGRGIFSMEFDHYDPLPTHLTQAVIDTHQKDLKEDE